MGGTDGMIINTVVASVAFLYKYDIIMFIAEIRKTTFYLTGGL